MAEKIKVLIPEKEVNARIEELGKKISEDTGIGMSEAYQQHIFEPFSQESDGVMCCGFSMSCATSWSCWAVTASIRWYSRDTSFSHP